MNLLNINFLNRVDIPQHMWQSAKEKSENEESTFICMNVAWMLYGLFLAVQAQVMVVGHSFLVCQRLLDLS